MISRILDDSATTSLYALDGAPARTSRVLGGAGSGNFGHAGRPGEVGGSTANAFPSHQLEPGYGEELGEVLSKKRWFFGGSSNPPITSVSQLRSPMFMTTDPESADWYAKERGPAAGTGRGSALYSFAVDVKNPFVIRGVDDAKHLKTILEDVGIKVNLTETKYGGWDWDVPAVDLFSDYEGTNLLDVAYIPTARQALQLQGYDALYALDQLEMDEIETLVVLDPSKIRSSFRSNSVAGWLRLLGSEKSGNYGHSGRPGQVGGSSGRNGTAARPADEIEDIETAEQGVVLYVTHFRDDKNASFTDDRHAYFHPAGVADFHNIQDVPGVLIQGTLTLNHPKVIPYQESIDLKASTVALFKAQGYDGVVNEDGSEVVAFSPRSALKEQSRQIGPPYGLEVLGGAGSGNFGHSGRPGEVGGSGPGVPIKPGTTPIPRGKIRGYHYTDDMDAVEREGLSAKKARGSTYGEPNAIWFSTAPPGDFKDYVEVFIDPDEIVQRGPLFSREDKHTEASQERIDAFNKGNHDFMVNVDSIGPDRFVTTHRPWHDRFRYIEKDESLRADVLAGEHDALLSDPEYGPAINAIKAGWKSVKTLGGAGSGNFGHAGGEGGPGNPGGSVTAGFTHATAAERKALGLPPAWTNVRVNPNPKGALQAVGIDAKGRQQYRYSAEHSEEAAAEKFARMDAFEKALPELRETLAKDMKSDDPGVREPAAVLHLIDKTAFRIGSTSETLGDVKAYGASTLEARHVKVDGDKVTFRFIGKKGVEIHKTLHDPALAKEMKGRLEGLGRKDRIFNTSDANTRGYMHEQARDFTPKDFRTRHATAMAYTLVQRERAPKTAKAYKVARREVGEKVSRYLGNTPTVALKSYINPAVFGKWEAAR